MLAALVTVALVGVGLVAAWGVAAVTSSRAQALADTLALTAVDDGYDGAHQLASRARRSGTLGPGFNYELFEVEGVTHAVVTTNGQQAVAAATR